MTQYDLRHGDFPASSWVADKCGVLQVKRFDPGCPVISIAVHVVSGCGLARSDLEAIPTIEREGTMLGTLWFENKYPLMAGRGQKKRSISRFDVGDIPVFADMMIWKGYSGWCKTSWKTQEKSRIN